MSLSVSDLCIRRGGREILRDVSLAFQPGTITAIVGPSGAGKSTLIAGLNGLLLPASGSIVMDGIGELAEASQMLAARRVTATIFQNHALIDRLSAMENVLLGLADARHPLSLMPWPRQMKLRAMAVLEDVGLLGKAKARADRLSGGERQRVGIARALIRHPQLLLGDEPFASVDPSLARYLGNQFRHLVNQRGMTVLLVLHQIAIARSLADRIIGLDQGRIVFDGAPHEFDVSAEASIFSSASQHQQTR